MDIKFEKDGIIKTTHEKFTKDLEAVGWRVVEDENTNQTGEAYAGKQKENTGQIKKARKTGKSKEINHES